MTMKLKSEITGAQHSSSNNLASRSHALACFKILRVDQLIEQIWIWQSWPYDYVTDQDQVLLYASVCAAAGHYADEQWPWPATGNSAAEPWCNRSAFFFFADGKAFVAKLPSSVNKEQQVQLPPSACKCKHCMFWSSANNQQHTSLKRCCCPALELCSITATVNKATMLALWLTTGCNPFIFINVD